MGEWERKREWKETKLDGNAISLALSITEYECTHSALNSAKHCLCPNQIAMHLCTRRCGCSISTPYTKHVCAHFEKIFSVFYVWKLSVATALGRLESASPSWSSSVDIWHRLHWRRWFMSPLLLLQPFSSTLSDCSALVQFNAHFFTLFLLLCRHPLFRRPIWVPCSRFAVSHIHIHNLYPFIICHRYSTLPGRQQQHQCTVCRCVCVCVSAIWSSESNGVKRRRPSSSLFPFAVLRVTATPGALFSAQFLAGVTFSAAAIDTSKEKTVQTVQRQQCLESGDYSSSDSSSGWKKSKCQATSKWRLNGAHK